VGFLGFWLWVKASVSVWGYDWIIKNRVGVIDKELRLA